MKQKRSESSFFIAKIMIISKELHFGSFRLRSMAEVYDSG
jgi:hypothetical protein